MEWFKMRTCWGMAIIRLTDEDAGRLLKAMLLYASVGEIEELDGQAGVLWSLIRPVMEEDIRQYNEAAMKREKALERRSNAARKAANARWHRE